MGFIFQGHRTYPAFLHFLFSITLLATYVAVMCISALWYAFHHPFAIVSRHWLLYPPDGLIAQL